ncbi:hypothetical protein M885DRAFT_140737 [Pelagophyceae sp. CCMP2097]|nr:hypothetical protein M885DRAFT_140737 [Pelagophyceae sp. CCMP2097]
MSQRSCSRRDCRKDRPRDRRETAVFFDRRRGPVEGPSTGLSKGIVQGTAQATVRGTVRASPGGCLKASFRMAIEGGRRLEGPSRGAVSNGRLHGSFRGTVSRGRLEGPFRMTVERGVSRSRLEGPSQGTVSNGRLSGPSQGVVSNGRLEGPSRGAVSNGRLGGPSRGLVSRSRREDQRRVCPSTRGSGLPRCRVLASCPFNPRAWPWAQSLWKRVFTLWGWRTSSHPQTPSRLLGQRAHSSLQGRRRRTLSNPFRRRRLTLALATPHWYSYSWSSWSLSAKSIFLTYTGGVVFERGWAASYPRDWSLAAQDVSQAKRAKASGREGLGPRARSCGVCASSGCAFNRLETSRPRASRGRWTFNVPSVSTRPLCPPTFKVPSSAALDKAPGKPTLELGPAWTFRRGHFGVDIAWTFLEIAGAQAGLSTRPRLDKAPVERGLCTAPRTKRRPAVSRPGMPRRPGSSKGRRLEGPGLQRPRDHTKAPTRPRCVERPLGAAPVILKKLSQSQKWTNAKCKSNK